MSHTVLALLVTAVLLPLAVSEFGDWCPRLAGWLVKWAARRLGDPEVRARYEEEWAANLDEVPGKLSPLLAAFGYLVAVPRMRWTLRRASTAVMKPCQIPSLSYTQVVRHADLAALDGRFTIWQRSGRGIGALTTTIYGAPGAGKTSLALFWAQRVKDYFPDGQLYVDLQNHEASQPLSPREVLGGLLRALGVHAIRVPRSLRARAKLYQTLVACRSLLIVLDNAATPAQVRSLIPDSPQSAMLILSRRELPILNTGFLRLYELTEDEALALLGAIIGTNRTDAEPEAARNLVKACACLPLAIHIAAGELRRGPGRSIADFVTMLTSKCRSLKGDACTDIVRAAFDSSYRALPEDVQRLFRRLSALPSSTFDRQQAMVLTQATAEDTSQLLDALINANLIVVDSVDGHCWTHDVLFGFARELLHEAEPSYRPDVHSGSRRNDQ